jgi:hypothetical protein
VCAATGERSDKFDPGTAPGSMGTKGDTALGVKGPKGDTAPGIKGPKGDAALKLLHSGKLYRHHTSLIQRQGQAVDSVCQRCHARTGIR